MTTFGLENRKPIGKPIFIGCKLSSRDESPSAIQTRNNSMRGGLQFWVDTWPNIDNAVGIMARFQLDCKDKCSK